MGVCSSDNCFQSKKKRKNTNVKNKKNIFDFIEEEYKFQEEDSSFKDNQLEQYKNRKSVQSFKSISSLREEYIAFPKGEHFYQLMKDSNISFECLFLSLKTEAQEFFFKPRFLNPSCLTPIEVENQMS